MLRLVTLSLLSSDITVKFEFTGSLDLKNYRIRCNIFFLRANAEEESWGCNFINGIKEIIIIINGSRRSFQPQFFAHPVKIRWCQTKFPCRFSICLAVPPDKLEILLTKIELHFLQWEQILLIKNRI